MSSHSINHRQYVRTEKKKIDKSFFVNNPPRARSHPLRPFPQQKPPYQNIDTRHKPPPVYQPKIDCDRSNGFNNHITVEKKRKLGPQNDVKVDQLHVCQQKIDCDRSKGSNIDITVAKKRKFGPKNDLKIDQPLSKTDGLSDFVFSSDTVSAFGLIVERFLSFSSLFLIKVSFFAGDVFHGSRVSCLRGFDTRTDRKECSLRVWVDGMQRNGRRSCGFGMGLLGIRC